MAFKRFETLRAYTSSRSVALHALKSIVIFKMDDFSSKYGRDPQKAYDHLITLLKDVISKGEVAKNEEFAIVALYMDSVRRQNRSADIRADDMRAVL